jgi:GDP-L-fucose synthase
VNISSGAPVALRDLASFVRDAVGYDGDIEWDTTKPDGTPDRQMDITRIVEMGWIPEVGLHEGLRLAYQDFLCQQHS